MLAALEGYVRLVQDIPLGNRSKFATEARFQASSAPTRARLTRQLSARLQCWRAHRATNARVRRAKDVLNRSRHFFPEQPRRLLHGCMVVVDATFQQGHGSTSASSLIAAASGTIHAEIGGGDFLFGPAVNLEVFRRATAAPQNRPWFPPDQPHPRPSFCRSSIYRRRS